MEEISDVISRYKSRLSKIPKRMPAEWKPNGDKYQLPPSYKPLCSDECDICGGSGYFRPDVPTSHDRFGKLEMCPNVDRWSLPYANRIGITEEEAQTLNWSTLKGYRDIKGIVQAAKAVKETLDRGYGWVFLHGTFGIGKTLILKIAVAEVLRQNKESAIVRMAEILDNLRESFDDDSAETETARMNWWTNLPVLCIDEFDKVRATEYGKERSFVLMDRRYDQAIRQGSVTLVASNESPNIFDGYLYDRIRDGRFHVCEISGESRRPGMRW